MSSDRQNISDIIMGAAEKEHFDPNESSYDHSKYHNGQQ